MFLWNYIQKTDLIFAVITDVIHAHEDGQKLPVLLEVQTLKDESAEGKQIQGLHLAISDSGS